MMLLPRFVPDKTRGERAHERRESIIEQPQRARMALPSRDETSGDKDNNRVHRRCDYNETEAQREQLCVRMGIARTDELRQEGHEKEHDLRVGEVDEEPG